MLANPFQQFLNICLHFVIYDSKTKILMPRYLLLAFWHAIMLEDSIPTGLLKLKLKLRLIKHFCYFK